MKKTENLQRTWVYTSLATKEERPHVLRGGHHVLDFPERLKCIKMCKDRIMLDISVVKKTLMKQNLWDD